MGPASVALNMVKRVSWGSKTHREARQREVWVEDENESCESRTLATVSVVCVTWRWP